MPHDAITRVGNLGRQQGMPKTITFADRFGHEIPDGDDDVDDDHDSDYDPDDSPTHSSTPSDDSLSVTSSSDEDLDSDNDDDDDDDDQPKQHTRGSLTGVGMGAEDDASSSGSQSKSGDESDDDEDDNGEDNNGNVDEEHHGVMPTSEDDSTESPDENISSNTINIPDEVISSPQDNATTGVSEPSTTVIRSARRASTGVGHKQEHARIKGEDPDTDNELDDDDCSAGSEPTPERTNTEDIQDQIRQDMDNKYGVRAGEGLRDRKPRSYDHHFAHDEFEHMMLTFQDPIGELFLTEQMPFRRGIKHFGKDGADAVVRELKQLDTLETVPPLHPNDLSREQKREALRYLMYLKQKRCAKVKARGCADGQPQRVYKSKTETSPQPYRQSQSFSWWQ
jgi:hypothetical protein